MNLNRRFTHRTAALFMIHAYTHADAPPRYLATRPPCAVDSPPWALVYALRGYQRPAATPSPVSCVISRLSVSDALERPRTSRPAPRLSLHMRWTGRTFARSTGEPPRDTGTTSSHSHESGSRTRRPSSTIHARVTSMGWPHSAHGSPAAARARHEAMAALRAFQPPTE